jgi:hypothetical protein
MAYKTEDLLATAIEAIKKNRLIFIEDIIAYLPCGKTAFYEHFPNETNNYHRMTDLLDQNRTELKVSMRSKWYKSNSPALQMALMKLLSNETELRKLSMQAIEQKVDSTIVWKETKNYESDEKTD